MSPVGPGWAFLRSRGLPEIGVTAAASVLAAWAAVPELQEVPLVSGRSALLLAWASCLPGVLAAVILAPPEAEREEAMGCFPYGWWRLGWVACLAAAPCLPHLVFTTWSGESLWWSLWYARNHLLMLAVTLVAASRLAPALAWAPGAVYALLCWFAGTTGLGGEPQPWALVHHAPDTWWIWLLIAAALGWGLWWHTTHVAVSS